MATYTYVAFSTPVAGRELELERWYDLQHIPDCLELEGFIAAQRFRIVADPVGANVPKWRVMVVYEIESDDVEATIAQISRVIRTPAMPMTNAIDLSTGVRILAAPVSPRYTKQDQ
jgi:hypothetical protein